MLTLNEMGDPVRRDDLDGDNWPLTWAERADLVLGPRKDLGGRQYAERAEEMTWLFQEDDRAFSQPTFLQAGKDYGDAPDEFVYVYSPCEGRRRRRNDHLELARVPRDKVRERGGI